MKFSRSKTTATLFALFLMFAMAFALVALPVANAHDPPWTVPTTAYVTCSPSTIGLGQYTTIVVWTDRYSPTAGGGIGQRWNGFKLDITKPDGTKETIGPWYCRSDVGSDYQVYTPDQLGTYTIVFSWPGETVVASPANMFSSGIGDFYEGSTSEPAYLIVQETPIEEWHEPPFPTEYWQRPINAANRGWSPLASNWLLGSSFDGSGGWNPNGWQPAGTGPESAHVLWTKYMTPGRTGGILDAQWPGISLNAEDYESPWGSPIIMNGFLYYNQPAVSDSAKYGYYCRDLYTGELIWYKNGTDNGLDNPFTVSGGYNQAQNYLRLTQGQIYHYHSVNGEGLLSYLIMMSGSTWYFLDAATGNWMLTLINVPGGTSVMDQDGSILKYSYNATTGNLLCWNSSQAIPPPSPVGTSQQQWKMRFGATIDAVNDTSWTEVGPSGSVSANEILPRSGYTMNVTIEKGLLMAVGWGQAPGPTKVLQDENRVPKMLFGYYKGLGSTIGASPDPDTFSAWAASINEHATDYSPFPNYTFTQNTNLGFTVTLLWNKNMTVPVPGKNYTWNLGGVSYDDQIFILECKQLRQRWAYSLETGALKWGPTPPEGAMNFYGASHNCYYGKVLSAGTDGTLYAYDAETGELLWTYNATTVGRESPYGDNYPLRIAAVCDGKVYTVSSEHSPSKPLWRGSDIRCVNITDGTEIWKLLNYKSFIGELGIADGFIIHASDYDNLIYCIGKGPSATTVTASPKVSVHGSSVLVEGMVTDTSPGTEELAQTARFANGVPAIADEDMEAWMEYLYEQQAKPVDATGVEVVLSVLDPNGNCYEVGRTTSDANGMFKKAFTPEVPGEYTVIAEFDGSKSYWPSTAETAINVEEAPAATPEPTPVPQAPVETYFAVSTIAIIVAIVIGFALLLLRKR